MGSGNPYEPPACTEPAPQNVEASKVRFSAILVGVVATIALIVLGKYGLNFIHHDLGIHTYWIRAALHFSLILVAALFGGVFAAALARAGGVRHAKIVGICLVVWMLLAILQGLVVKTSGHSLVKPLYVYLPVLAALIPISMAGGHVVCWIKRRR